MKTLNYYTYGNSNNPILLIIPGAGIGSWGYKSLIAMAQADYYLVIIDLTTSFTSINQVTHQLQNIINTKFNGQVKTIAGLSIGSQIALRLIADDPHICNHLLLESCATFPQSIAKLVPLMVNLSYPLTRFNWFNKLQASTLRLPLDEYHCYYQEIAKMTKETLLDILTANTNFDARTLPLKFKGKMIITYGTKENQLMIKSGHYLSKKFSNARVLPFKNYYHGELTLRHPATLFKLIKSFDETH